jgi:hypothetical protein
MTIVPVSLKDANAYVESLHRHHKKVTGHKFSIGVRDKDGVLRGVAIVGRPVSRHLDNGVTLEVNRLCTDGMKNACSALYAAAARAGREMGYHKIITYILATEPGTSLLAAGWEDEGPAGGGFWGCKSRPRTNTSYPTMEKRRYSKRLCS